MVGERHRCLIERISKGDDDGVDAGAVAVGYRVISKINQGSAIVSSGNPVTWRVCKALTYTVTRALSEL